MAFTEWHYAAAKKTLKDIPKHLFTKDVLNESEETFGLTVWHVAAQHHVLKDIPEHLFSKQALELFSFRGETVLETIAKWGSIKDLPKRCVSRNFTSMTYANGKYIFHEHDREYIKSITHSLHNQVIKGRVNYEEFTSELLDERDFSGKTVLYYAVKNDDIMKNMPPGLFFLCGLREKHENGDTVWHTAARHNTLQYIPKEYFSNDALSEKNDSNESVFECIVKNKQIKHIPISFINEAIDSDVLTQSDKNYVKKVVDNRINSFLTKCPKFKEDITNRDPRLVFTDSGRRSLSFVFKDMDDLTITVNINGISMNGVTYDTLSDAIKDAPIKELALPKTKFRISTSCELK